MKHTVLSTLLVAGTLMGGTAAQASLIDFTAASEFGVSINQVNGTTLTGTAGTGWTGVAGGGNLNFLEAGPGPAAVTPLDGDIDGLGIADDEISNPAESFTITFNGPVTIVALYFLDLFSPEEAIVEVDGEIFSFTSVTPLSEGVGFGSFEGLSLTGSVFTFTADAPTDVGAGDYALAGIDLAPIPLPAGLVLLGGALGALGVARRRKSA